MDEQTKKRAVRHPLDSWVFRMPSRHGLPCECGPDEECVGVISLGCGQDQPFPCSGSVFTSKCDRLADWKGHRPNEFLAFEHPFDRRRTCTYTDQDGEDCGSVASFMRVCLDPSSEEPRQGMTHYLCQDCLSLVMDFQVDRFPLFLAVYVPHLEGGPGAVYKLSEEEVQVRLEWLRAADRLDFKNSDDYRRALAEMSRSELEDLCVLQWEKMQSQKLH